MLAKRIPLDVCEMRTLNICTYFYNSEKRLMNSPPYCLQQCTEGNNWFCQDQLICGLSICSNLAGVQERWTNAEITFFFKNMKMGVFPSMWSCLKHCGRKSCMQLSACETFGGWGWGGSEGVILLYNSWASDICVHRRLAPWLPAPWC